MLRLSLLGRGVQSLSSEILCTPYIKYPSIFDFIMLTDGLWMNGPCYGSGKAEEFGTGAGSSWESPPIPSSVCIAHPLLVITVVKSFLGQLHRYHTSRPLKSPSAVRPPSLRIPILCHIQLQITSLQGWVTPRLLCWCVQNFATNLGSELWRCIWFTMWLWKNSL